MDAIEKLVFEVVELLSLWCKCARRFQEASLYRVESRRPINTEPPINTDLQRCTDVCKSLPKFMTPIAYSAIHYGLSFAFFAASRAASTRIHASSNFACFMLFPPSTK